MTAPSDKSSLTVSPAGAYPLVRLRRNRRMDWSRRLVAEHKLSVDDLYGSSRSQAIATARQIAMYLCRELTNLSLPKIGQLFGNRDHTTVMYANKKISELMKERRSIYNQVTELPSRIKQDHRYK